MITPIKKIPELELLDWEKSLYWQFRSRSELLAAAQGEHGIGQLGEHGPPRGD